MVILIVLHRAVAMDMPKDKSAEGGQTEGWRRNSHMTCAFSKKIDSQ